MSRIVTGFKLCAALAVVVGVGIFVGWWGTGGALRPAPVAPASVPASAESLPPASAPPVDNQSRPTQPLPRHAPQVRLAAAPDLLPNWQDRLDNILGSQADGAAKADQLLQILPRVPQEAQIEVAQYASNLMPDTNYAAVGAYLTNSSTAEPVLDVLLAGLLNRPDSVKLPYLLALARDEDHPKAEQAHLYLQTFLEKDFGQDWSQWQASIDQHVKQPPQY